ncbi:pyridoxamine 5'-phosphate oxidase [Nitrospirillum viridazoti]|uniref:Pyridoxine/pyridoxamine 5'-phosphate oxidase n=1 Tax=Nitrospirillum amazonense TaxID=28077 RepID=A0A560HVE1_9PROT|nr:pyridoxamine 5'-phosphate oxidase [Nitrospirillum amazonense]TWB49901.1 pyridoxamine 5'-phosphate oxidase [Nitrospirillum amazonense]
MDFVVAPDPYVLFQSWLDEASRTEPNDPNAMSLATIGADGIPAVRIVLLKGLDDGGFVFYTNTLSRKGRELAAHPVAGLCFHWKSLRRQVRVDGRVSPVTAQEADDYYRVRPRGSQIGAWASAQSQPLDSRATLERRVAEETARFGEGDIPRPPHWSGYRVTPARMEFWQDREFRLHDRLVYTRDAEDKGWMTERLYP